jgi:hypothetical protein
MGKSSIPPAVSSHFVGGHSETQGCAPGSQCLSGSHTCVSMQGISCAAVLMLSHTLLPYFPHMSISTDGGTSVCVTDQHLHLLLLPAHQPRLMNA